MRRLLFFLIVVLWPLGLVAQVDDDGPGLLARFLQDVLSEDARQVRIRGFQGALSTRATVREITIADEVGDWVTVRNAVIDWDRSALLRGRLIIQELAADEIILMRRPGKGDGTIAPEASGIGLPNLPVSIEIDRVATQRVVLREAFYGTAATVSINGSVLLDGGSGEADLQILRTDGNGDGSLSLDADYSESTGILNLDFLLTETANGVAANALRIPDRPSVRLALRGNAPLDDFTARIELETDGIERLAGTFNTFASDDVADDEVRRRFGADIAGDVAPIFAPQYRDFFGDDVVLSLAGTTRLDGSLNIDRMQINAGEIGLGGSLELDPDRIPTRMALQGRIASRDGSPVLLPLPGRPTMVEDMRLDVDFDADRGEAWSGEVVMTGFSRPSFTAERLALFGGGAISEEVIGGGSRSRVTGAFDFEASALDLGNDKVQQALGQTVTGRMEVAWTEGQPVELQTLRIDGDSYTIDIVGEVAGVGRDLRVNGAATLSARDLAAFSGLAGRQVGGAAELSIIGNGDLLGGRFDVLMTGEAQDLTLDQRLADQLLVGGAELRVHSIRDEAGTRIEEFIVTSAAVRAEGSGVLRTDATEITLTASLDDAGRLVEGLSGPVVLEGVLEEGLDRVRFNISGTGPETALTTAGTFGGAETPHLLSANSVLVASDLSIFAPLTGLDLTGSAELSVQTQLDTETYSGTVTLNGTGQNLGVGNERVDTMLAGNATVSARLSRVPGRTNLNSFAVVTPILTASAVGVLEGERRALTLNAKLEDAGLVVESLAGPLSIEGHVTQSGPDRLDVNVTGEGQSFDLIAVGALSALDDVPLFIGTARVDSPDISVFSALAKRPISGEIDVTVEGSTRVDLSTFDLDVAATSVDLIVGQGVADRLLAGRTRYNGKMRRDDDVLRLQEASIDSTAAAISAAGVIAPDATDLTFDATVKEAALLLRDVSGALNLKGSVRQTGPDRFALDVTGTGAGTDIAAKGTLETPPEGTAFSGNARVEVNSLGAFSQLAGRPLSGSVSLDASGRARLDVAQFVLELDGVANDLGVGIAPIDRMLAGRAQVNAALDRGPDGLVVRDFDIKSTLLQADAQGTLSGAESDLQFAARVDPRAFSDRGSLPPIALVGRFEGAADGTVGLDVTGSGPGASVRLSGELKDRSLAPSLSGNANLSVEDLSLYAELIGRPVGGNLAAEARGDVALDLSEFDVVASGSGGNLLLGAPLLDRVVAGRATFRIDASRQDGRTMIRQAEVETPVLTASASGQSRGEGQALRVDARLNDIAPFLSALSGPATASGTLTELDGGVWLADLQARGPGDINARINGRLSPDGSSYQATGSAPLDFAERYLGTRSITGLAFFDVAFDDRTGIAGLSGTVRGNDLRIFAPKLNFEVYDGSFRADIGGGRAWLEATGAVRGGGTIRATGPVALSEPFPARLELQMTDARLRDPTLFDTTLSGTVTLSGPLLNGGRIDGEVDLGPTVIRFPTGSLGVRGPIPVIGHLNEPADVRRTRAAAGLLRIDPRGDGSGIGRRPPFDLDILLNAPRGVFVRGLGLDSEFGGQVRLTGHTLAVKPRGQLGLINGRFDLLGRQLTLTQGALRLEGSFLPVVRMSAHIRDGDADLMAVLEGPVMAPRIRFSSVPELPENQIIARLLYREGAERLTLLQATRIGTTAMQLGGPAAGSGIIARLRDGFGVDYLDLAKDVEGGAAVRAGKYVADGAYAEVTVGERATDLSVRLNLNEDLTLKGSVDTSGESRLGVFFGRDY